MIVESAAMPGHTPRKPHHPHPDPDDREPGLLPVDPDEGPVFPSQPADPEHEPGEDPQV
jgi:hypothetical protein